MPGTVCPHCDKDVKNVSQNTYKSCGKSIHTKCKEDIATTSYLC